MSWTDADIAPSSNKASAWSDDDTTAPAAPLKSISDRVLHRIKPTSLAKTLYGGVETAAQMGSGMVGQVLGGFRGIGSAGYDTAANLLSGKSLGDSFVEAVPEATRKIKETEHALTYQPRTQSGQEISGALGEGMEWVNTKVGQAGGAVGEAVGGAKGRAVGESIGEIIIPVAGTLLGGAGALRGVKGVTASDALRKGKELVTDVAETPAYIQSQLLRKRPPTKEQVEGSMMNADNIRITNSGMDLGLKVDPSVTKPSRFNSVGKAVAGAEDLNEALTAVNMTKGTEIVKRDLGIHPNAEINMDTITSMRNQANAPNEYIRNLGNQITVDAPTLGEIQQFKIRNPAVGQETVASNINSLVDRLDTRINAGEMTAPEIMEQVRLFREEARRLRNKKDPDTGDNTLAAANRSLADTLENSVERGLQRLSDESPTHGYDKLAEQFRKGRTDMARSYLLEDILDKKSGKIDFGKLADEVADNPSISGEMKTVGEFAGRYPELFSSTERPTRSFLEKHILSRTTVPGMAAGLVTTGPLGALAGYGANRLGAYALRKKMMGDKAQQAARPIDYRSAELRNAELSPMITEAPLPPGPRPFGRITMADDGPLPTTRQNIEPTVRPTMELTPMEAQSAALRNKGARTPLREGEVEFTPGGGQDFMLRQEVMQTPEVVQITEQARAQMNDLNNKIANSQGFWKQKYEAELADLEQQFGTMMESLGVRTPQEAIGLQPLYEGQTQGRLPVQKTFDPRSEALRSR